MSTIDLEERVAELEVHYAELRKLVQNRPTADAWRSVVGMFAEDPHIEEHHRETLQIREADRAATRHAGES